MLWLETARRELGDHHLKIFVVPGSWARDLISISITKAWFALLLSLSHHDHSYFCDALSRTYSHSFVRRAGSASHSRACTV